MTRPRFWPVCALLIALVSAACSGVTSSSPGPSGRLARNATTAPLLPLETDSLPQMDAAGYQQLLAQLRGTPLLVNFWAAWCAPCREETPLLVDAHSRYGDRVQFLGVDILDSREGAERFVAEFSMAYPSVFDPQNAIGLTYDLFAPPMTVFIDEWGRVVALVPGQISADELEENLQAIAG